MMKTVPDDEIDGALKEYKCIKDKDIESFLQTKAITYERRGWCSTYLQIDEDEFFRNHTINVQGFFSLSNKVIHLSNTVSKRMRKRMFGGLNKDERYAHVVLIGQLGKFINQDGEENVLGKTSARELLDKAFRIIYQVKERITCNCVLVECNDHPKLRKVYEDYGFCELQKDGDVIQYAKML